MGTSVCRGARSQIRCYTRASVSRPTPGSEQDELPHDVSVRQRPSVRPSAIFASPDRHVTRARIITDQPDLGGSLGLARGYSNFAWRQRNRRSLRTGRGGADCGRQLRAVTADDRPLSGDDEFWRGVRANTTSARRITLERFDRGDGSVKSNDPTMRGVGLTTVTARVIGQVHTFHGWTVGIDNYPAVGDFPITCTTDELVEIASGHESAPAFILRMERHKITLDVRCISVPLDQDVGDMVATRFGGREVAGLVCTGIDNG